MDWFNQEPESSPNQILMNVSYRVLTSSFQTLDQWTKERSRICSLVTESAQWRLENWKESKKSLNRMEKPQGSAGRGH